ncbi:tetrapyrrole methylase [Gorgonomyces haynaldii]|nr:tetrapyrrole methylase [Gorgonomyces haynaldii]
MVLCCIDDPIESRRIALLCRKMRIPVNCADIPDLCDFYFMAQFRQGALQIAVSTNGGGPRLGVKIRNAIVKQLDPNTPDAVTCISIIREGIRKTDDEAQRFGVKIIEKRMKWISSFCDQWEMQDLVELYRKDLTHLIVDAYKQDQPVPLPPSKGGLLNPTTMDKIKHFPVIGVYLWFYICVLINFASLVNDRISDRFVHMKGAFKTTSNETKPLLATTHTSQQVSKKDVPEATQEQPQQQEPEALKNEPHDKQEQPQATNNQQDRKEEREEQKEEGVLYLAGAGPGNPDLLTRQVYRLLTECDMVISDRLVPQPILDLVPSERLELCMPKEKGNSDLSQDETNLKVLDLLKQNKKVMRLKTGDIFMFGRGGEETLFFRSHGFDPILCPGLTSVTAGPTQSMIPLTHRGTADAVLILSGRGQNNALPTIPEYDSKRTTVMLMVMKRIREIVDLLVEKGYPKDVPCAILERSTWPEQRTIHTTLQALPEQSPAAPALLVIGDVCTVLQPQIWLEFDNQSKYI